MAAQNPQGGMKYWLNGEPFGGILKTGTTIDVVKYWLNGEVTGYVYPYVVVGPQILKIAEVDFSDIDGVSEVVKANLRKVAGVNAA
jgi:hypothetical protein